MIFDKQNKEKSVGLPAPHVNIKLINEKGCEDKIGTIWINGPNVIKNTGMIHLMEKILSMIG